MPRISAVNLSEVLAQLQEIRMPEAESGTVLARLNLRVIAFDEPQARAAARLCSVTRHVGLSHGERACWALAGILGCPPVPVDRVWANVDAGVEVIVIR
jgi:ribonuclease VapC